MENATPVEVQKPEPRSDQVDISMDPLGADLLLYTEVLRAATHSPPSPTPTGNPDSEVFSGLDTKKESRVSAEVIERRFGVVVTSKGLANIINKKPIEAQLKGIQHDVHSPFDLDGFLVLMAVCQERAAA